MTYHVYIVNIVSLPGLRSEYVGRESVFAVEVASLSCNVVFTSENNEPDSHIGGRRHGVPIADGGAAAGGDGVMEFMAAESSSLFPPTMMKGWIIFECAVATAP